MKNNKCIRYAPYLRNSIAWDHEFGTHVWNDDITKCFFQFFKILIFRVVRGVKGQKTVQNDKKLCSSYFISQKPYIIWMSFMVHMCKMIISPAVFFIFSKCWFFRVLRGKSAKNGPKWQKILSVMLHISGIIHHMIVIYGTHV